MNTIYLYSILSLFYCYTIHILCHTIQEEEVDLISLTYYVQYTAADCLLDMVHCIQNKVRLWGEFPK